MVMLVVCLTIDKKGSKMVAKGRDLNTYVFKVELKQEEDGRWSSTVPALAGCFSWGHTREEALETIEENVRA